MFPHVSIVRLTLHTRQGNEYYWYKQSRELFQRKSCYFKNALVNEIKKEHIIFLSSLQIRAITIFLECLFALHHGKSSNNSLAGATCFEALKIQGGLRCMPKFLKKFNSFNK